MKKFGKYWPHARKNSSAAFLSNYVTQLQINTTMPADYYVQRSGQVVHVMDKRLQDLSHLPAGYELRSRDFH